MCTDRHDDDDNDATQNCRMSGSVELITNIGITSKTETYRMSESVEPFTNIETARPQYAVDDAFIKTPHLQEINRLFAHIDIEHEQLRNINDPDTSICENVIRILDTPLPGVEFWKTNFRIDYGEHRKTAATTTTSFCRLITL